MPKTKRRRNTVATTTAQRVKLTPTESLKRMQDFAKRKENFVAVVRKSKNRGLST